MALLLLACDPQGAHEVSPAGVEASDEEQASEAGPPRSKVPETAPELAPSEAAAKPAQAGRFMKGEYDTRVSVREPLFVRADGSGMAVSGVHLRDPGLFAKRLDLVVVPGRFGTNMAIRKGAKATVRLSPHEQATRVEVVSKHVTTPAGVAVGMRYEELVAKVPGTKCRAEPGEGGEFLHCEVDVGVHAVIEAPRGLGDGWDANVMKPEKAERLAGDAKVSSLEAWYSDVPKPSAETEVGSNAEDKGGLSEADRE